MKLTVGLTKKAGLPGYGSVAAACQLESGELPASLSVSEFHERVARAFDACRSAVEAELANHRFTDQRSGGTPAGERGPRPPAIKERPATPRQLKALRGLAARSRLPSAELGRLFGKPVDVMTVAEASAAIDRLKGVAPLNGHGTCRNGKGDV